MSETLPAIILIAAVLLIIFQCIEWSTKSKSLVDRNNGRILQFEGMFDMEHGGTKKKYETGPLDLEGQSVHPVHHSY